jgi:proton-translocating NADH-quinone oxidoreductase chain N
LGLDVIQPHQEEKHWLPYVALVGLIGALIATIALWGCNTRVFFVLSCDPFALVVKMIALVAMVIIVLCSDVYIRAHSQHQGEFYALLIFSALTMCLLGAATNLILVFLTFDFLSITSFILTGYLRDDRHSIEAAIKYCLYGAALSAVLIYGVSWFYGLTGSTDLGDIAATLRETEHVVQPIVLLALIFTVAGLAFKIGAAPFHQWTPDAYEGAPTPVAAFLSVGPKIAGSAIIIRLLLTVLPPDLEIPTLDWRTLLMTMAVLTMTVGNLVALWQQNVRRLLAYSSIAQVGYILIGVATATPRGVTAALLYLTVYTLTSLGAFAAVIAFSNETGSDVIKDYAGLSERAPSLALAMIVCLLSFGGIPPTAGFIGKLYLFSAAIEEGLLWLAIVGVINSVISLSYYWKIIRAMYIIPVQTKEPLRASPTLAVALGTTVVGVLTVGIFPGIPLALIRVAMQTFFQ